MRIMIVTDAWHPQINGVVRAQEKIVNGLRARGHDVVMITPQDYATIFCPTYPEIRLSLFPGRSVARAIRQLKPDHLHISTEGPLGLAARAEAMRNNLAFTTTYHTRFPEYVYARVRIPLSWTYCFIRWFHNPAKVVMAPTRTVIEDLKKWRVGRPALCSYGVDLDLFAPDKSLKRTVPNAAEKTSPRRPVFINVGRLAVEKNLEAFLDLDLEGEKWIVGGGPRLGQLKRKYPDVKFFGPKPMNELPALYNQADVFVFPSKTDTFGLVLLEAMGCGLPVAAYPVAGPLDVIGDADAGVLDEDLGRACRKALSIPHHVPREYAKNFSWDKSVEIFENYLTPMRLEEKRKIAKNPHQDIETMTRAGNAIRNSWSGLVSSVREKTMRSGRN